jgi:hypothetical protein
VQTYVSAVRAGGTMKLLHVGKRFRDLLAVAKLDRVVELVESVDDESDGTADRMPQPERIERRADTRGNLKRIGIECHGRSGSAASSG